MDTSYNYPHLFDIDDTDLLHGLNLQDSPTNNNDTLYNRKLSNTEDNSSFSSANNSSYLHYLENNTSNTQDLFYDRIYQQQNQHLLMSNIGLDLDIPDYQQQKPQYNWLYDPNNNFLPTHTNMFYDESIMTGIIPPPTPTNNQQSYDCFMSENENIMVEGGMSRGYVSLSDVNSFVAKADSTKHSCLLLSDNLLLDDFPLKRSQRDFLSSSESTNDDSEDEYSDNNSELDLRWPRLTATSYSTPTTANRATNKANARQKLMIKIKKTSQISNMNSALPSPYGEHHWDSVAPKASKSTNCRNTKQQRKSMSNIYGEMTSQHYKKKKSKDKGRRGSAPHRVTLHNSHSNASLNSLYSSSSLSSLSNNLQRSMRVSDIPHSFISSDAEEEEELVEDEDDEEYRSTTTNGSVAVLPSTKKGRNVDKACNHCKRSHLRCDDMRPCRRCVATGKTGCKDVQHKPRGRPKLHKK